MILLIIGLLLFLGIHSVRIFAEQWRSNFIAQKGANTYKRLYSIVSAVGLALIIFGYGQTRQSGSMIWSPPAGMAHLASLLVLIAFVLMAAAYVPGNRIKAAVGHPMAASVKLWAFAHLLANGRAGDVVLFGAFLAWAIASYVTSRKRDRREGVVRTVVPSIAADGATVACGVLAWLVFAMWLHAPLIGVSPFGG